MEELQPDPILEFRPNQLYEVRKLFNKDAEKLNQDLDILENWIKKQNHFTIREFDRSYLERYLIANKGSVERAKKRLDKLLTLRNLLPELTKNYDITNEFTALFKCSHQFVLPKLTMDYYRVVISKIYDTDYEGVELLQYYRYLLVWIEYMLHHDYNAGYEFVMDARDINFGLVAKMNPIIVHKAMTIVEAYGFRLKALHYVSGSKFFETILSIIKQGTSKKLRNRFIVHSNIESLYKYIPREMLPEDYGGSEKSVKEIWENSFRQISSDEHIARMKHMEGVVTDEKYRLSSNFNEEYSGIPGSFKTLCVD